MLKIIVGLGNPRIIFKDTYHNLGFCVIDYLAFSLKCGVSKEKFEGIVAEICDNTDRILLVNPLIFMNSSGRCISIFMNFFNINFENMMVVCNDLAFEISYFLIRFDGTHGGNIGLMDIQNYFWDRLPKIGNWAS